jgi:hypothetical protein
MAMDSGLGPLCLRLSSARPYMTRDLARRGVAGFDLPYGRIREIVPEVILERVLTTPCTRTPRAHWDFISDAIGAEPVMANVSREKPN